MKTYSSTPLGSSTRRFTTTAYSVWERWNIKYPLVHDYEDNPFAYAPSIVHFTLCMVAAERQDNEDENRSPRCAIAFTMMAARSQTLIQPFPR